MSGGPSINKILRSDPRPCRYGAPMGDRGFDDRAEDESKVNPQRVRFIDGDYGPDGTYWGGGGTPLWCAFNKENTLRRYVRARARGEAIDKLRKEYREHFNFY